MINRIGAVTLVAALGLMGCPPNNTNDDAGDTDFDAGNPLPVDGCSGGCAANQICDTKKRVCVDACGGCDAGNCTNVGPSQYQCIVPAVTCQGQVCEPGQLACLGGGCACLAAANNSQDTCTPEGKWCTGNACSNPRVLDQCIPGGPPCPTGHICEPVFGEDLAICVLDCGGLSSSCPRGELCAGVNENTQAAGCLPQGLFRGQECNQHIPDGLGGWVKVDGGTTNAVLTVPVSNTCLLKDGNGNITDPAGYGTGNCTYAMFKFFDDGNYPFRTCRPPGQALEGQPCRTDWTGGAIATQCGTGLECMVTNGDQGVCMKMCNANPERPGFTPAPACGATEACVNLYRYTDSDDNAVVGVCMKTCDVFDAAKSTCANVGTTPTSCVPASATGQLLLSLDGAGICVPQQPTVATEGQPCTEVDPFRGAACASALMCTSLTITEAAQCLQVCDTECNPADGGSGPSRCATAPNVRCGSGKSCRRVTSTTGAHVGYCQ